MPDENNQTIAAAIPFEWAVKKLLGPTFDEVGTDIQTLYKIGREKLSAAAIRKSNIEDGKKTNLRVTRDVFWNGSFTDESICAEYFGGVLASSRSEDGKDDRGIYYTDIIKSLSSQQLLLHYIIYSSFNKLWLEMPTESPRPNVGMMKDLQSYNLWIASHQIDPAGKNIEKDIIALASKGLIGSTYAWDNYKIDEERILPYLKAQPSTLGVQLYAVAHNKLSEWRKIPFEDFGSFPDIALPSHSAFTIEELLEKINIGKI